MRRPYGAWANCFDNPNFSVGNLIPDEFIVNEANEHGRVYEQPEPIDPNEVARNKIKAWRYK